MPICNWPGCGYVFPKGQKVPDKCPNCERSPFARFNPDTGETITYTKEELIGRRILLERAT